MCPPVNSSPREIDSSWNDEQLILLLYNFPGEANLPCNVLVDTSPYQHLPSNLPERMWFIVSSAEKKDSVHGIWKACEEPSEIYSDSAITGWRTTLEFFESQALSEQKTDWIMREYSITLKESCGKENSKFGIVQGSRVLCRVFLRSGDSSKSETGPQKCKAVIESGETNLQAPTSSSINNPPNQDSEKWVSDLAMLIDVDANRTNHAPAPQDFNELDEIMRQEYLQINALIGPLPNAPPPLLRDNLLGLNDLVQPVGNRSPAMDDFLELNDLIGEASQSSSSHSSCTSTVSDEYFDSVTLLREMEEEANRDIQVFAAPDRPNDAILPPPAPTGSLPNDAARIEVAAPLQTGPTATLQTGRTDTESENVIDKKEPEHGSKRQNSDIGSSSGGDQGAGPSEERKSSPSRLKKLKLFLCFSF